MTHELDQSQPARYVVGMDLGTTNSAVAFVDSQAQPWRVQMFAIKQLVAPGTIEQRETLPSFHYQAANNEFPAGALRLPWTSGNTDACVGVMAREFGGAQPGRLIASAKSWLCHPGVDRTAELLPWHGAEDVTRLSPVDASARYLRHVRECWDAQHPSHPLAEQDFVLTLPASFDEVARELTVAAAAKAGLPRVILIEEPQAAFYAWLDQNRDNWEQLVSAGQTILVIDIGGGTTDLTLIRARAGDDGRVRFQRIAVGEHLILGGDNLDLALAQFLEPRLSPQEGLAARQWDQLVRQCRRIKESLLGRQPPETFTVSVTKPGSKLLSGSLQCEVTRAEVLAQLVDGFLPAVSIDARPQARRSGFQEFGLPYATDAAITKYLAAFLTDHRRQLASEAGTTTYDPARPDVVLFNGGFFHSPDLRQQLLRVLCSWFDGTTTNPHGSATTNWQPLVLDDSRLDLAVAQGAAYYGMVLRGHGVRIAADLARSYYLGVEAHVVEQNTEQGPTDAAVCVVPASAVPGEEQTLPQSFELLVSEPVEFPLYTSSTRLSDPVGTVVPVVREQFTELAPIRTVLQVRGKTNEAHIPVRMQSRLSEIGTLELWCQSAMDSKRWKMEFDVRAAIQTDRTAHRGSGEQAGFVDEATITAAFAELRATFDVTNNEPASPDTLMQRLSDQLQLNRNDWPPTLLRRIWAELLELEAGRRRSPLFESRWLNLLGYSLRPGYGVALDDWRVAETWKLLNGKLAHGVARVKNEWWILWRRLAGGLNAGQQRALAEPLLADVRGLHKRLTTGKGGGDLGLAQQESVEIWRLLGALELLPPKTKHDFGQLLIELLPKKKLVALRPALLWALGRVGARVPVYGPLNVVPQTEVVSRWIETLLEQLQPEALDHWVIMQLARKTGDRYRDLSPSLQIKIINKLTEQQVEPHLLTLIREGGTLLDEEQSRVFGESLPKGLRIR